MKHLYLLISIILLSNISFAQETRSEEGNIEKRPTPDVVVTERVIKKEVLTLKDGSYEFTQSLPKDFSTQIEMESATPFESTKGYKVTVLYEQDGYIFFKYWNFEKDTPLYDRYNKNNPVFSMKKEAFLDITKQLYSRYKGIEFGAYTVPFRFRGIGGDNFDFESSLSLQANLVAGFGTRYDPESWYDLSLGLGITSVDLTSKNSNVTEDRTASAFTISMGHVFKPAKYANLGFFIGWDFLGQKDNDTNWVFDGKPWIGLGINISFNQIETDKPANGNQ